MPESNEIGRKIARASRVGDVAFLEEVFASDIDVLKVTESEHWNYLHKANLSKASPADTIKFFIENGVPVNAQDMYGMTPLHYAVRSHNLDAVRLLLKAGANPNLLNDDGKNPLRQIINLNHSEDDIAIIKLLVDNGIDLSEKKEGGKTVVEVLKLFDPEPIELIEYMEAALEV